MNQIIRSLMSRKSVRSFKDREIPEDIMKLMIKYILQDCVIIIDTMDNLGASF